MKIIDARNQEELAVGGTAVHGITKFSDITEEEFKKRFLNLDASKLNLANVTVAEITRPVELGTAVDWAGVYTTAVKDQGYCGSCWAFSATEQIESETMRTLGKTYVLAPQQIVSCDTSGYDDGCDGGLPEWAFDYVKKVGGLEQESDYPYTSGVSGEDGRCTASSSKYVVTVTGYTQIRGESQMASYVQSTGPLSVCVDASRWSSYTGGVFNSCGHSINHAVQAVGVDTSSGGYWKIRNSWGPSWGEDGYIRIPYGSNACDITYAPLYAAVQSV